MLAAEVKQRRGADTGESVELLREMLSRQHDALVEFEPVVREGVDPEGVHKMRVAVRRLRSILRTAKPMLDAHRIDELRRELDWLGGMLGAVRDADVLSAALKADIACLNGGDATRAAGLLEPLREEHRSARARLLAALDDARYTDLLAAVRSVADHPPVTGAGRSLRQLAAKDVRRVRKQRPKRLRRLNDAQLHKQRIRVKRARYAAELVEPSVGKKAARFVDAAKEVQDVLGANQDAVVASRRLRDLARKSPRRGAALVAGRLLEQQERRKLQRRREQLVPVWRRLRKAGKRGWNL
jgi:CHAD domain-containing protein